MKETMSERPPMAMVSKIGGGWLLTINHEIEETEDGYACYSYSKMTDHRPTADDVLATAVEAINQRTDERILSGFVWNGKNVWLSSENQFNFKAAYDLALQTGGATLPVKFKLGEDGSGKPVYHTFGTLEEFTDFYTQAIGYINAVLVDGWERKDALEIEDI